ncbi:similar to Saccharomyces cerevisiae YDR382W RPP2B Ribosomal protein P2 beta [Maudiozyma barnettii]|uniref:Similar to Saccharomyces cerevisiae YDR382W RPP2B Ribosomal protein P2 beta n=1 Tax=Maudiozyma barnettii TaxID=61262 RepID=A0A8H2VEP0_9SACH|nr:ribosomal protein P2B [Kazachstania barnettii]CAB4253739.1 similar to Saccharomyces cerevisiae YDR382W RPP2B Ribosomal protein P2 beta [Kazachstania barnettii]CAD1781487.1 similar to Saccharomyces cerevisiae YDR382W RPP2B Ribosomal protein P2 beta [Kazachstania barnettii]
MKYLAAYLLLVQGGNTTPSAADIKTVVESVGIEADDSRISELLSSLEGKGSLDEIIAAGSAKFASAPAAGAAAVGGSAAAGSAAGEAAEEAEEEAKEESDDDMGFGLFD